VQAFSPEGAVKGVRQVTARFSSQMVAFGDPRAPDPFTVDCAEKGKGRGAGLARRHGLPAPRAPRIVYPADGSIIAIDPDIPQQVERIVLRAQAGQDLRWRLDGTILAPADAPAAWRPLAGEHWLELVDQAGKAIASSRFEVRGERPAGVAAVN